MNRFGEFLGRQARFLLEDNNKALLYIVILSVLPFTVWLASSVVVLITLRKGWNEGFKGFAVAFVALLVSSLITVSFNAALLTAIIAFLPCYLTAGVLHSTASWKIASGFLVLQALFGLILVHWLTPEYIIHQYQHIQALLNEIERQGSDTVSALLLYKQAQLNPLVIANYILGIQAVSLVLSTLVSIMLARSVQSRLFYPGGFKQELLAFRAWELGLIILILVAIGAYWHYPLALSCLPILVVYYAVAGLSFSVNLLAKGRGIGILILLLVALTLLPFVMIPIYVIVGALDSLFNFRLYFSSRENKG